MQQIPINALFPRLSDRTISNQAMEIQETRLAERLIVGPVYIGVDDGAGLHKHIVTARRNGPRTHGVRVPRCPGYLDRMYIREPSDERDHREINPLRGELVKGVKSNEKRERPELQDDGSGHPAIDDLAEISSE